MRTMMVRGIGSPIPVMRNAEANVAGVASDGRLISVSISVRSEQEVRLVVVTVVTVTGGDATRAFCQSEPCSTEQGS